MPDDLREAQDIAYAMVGAFLQDQVRFPDQPEHQEAFADLLYGIHDVETARDIVAALVMAHVELMIELAARAGRDPIEVFQEVALQVAAEEADEEGA